MLVVAVLVTIMMAALAIAMRRDDAAINANRAIATATVLTVSPLRTGIEFVDATGTTVRPPTGVLYPGLLTVGQRFVVEYSTVDPSLVRVAGRTAAVGTVMIATVLMVSWLVAAPLAWWFRRRSGLPLLRRSLLGRLLPDRSLLERH